LASFKGNTGDVINHAGFYGFLDEHISEDYEITQLEIRLFYKNRQERAFDQSFVDEVNTYDLLVLGGGNFLSPWLETSETGTTFDITMVLLRAIKAKILINAVGCEKSLGYSSGTLEKLGLLLEYAKENPSKILFTVRNDGSYEAINDWYNNRYNDLVIKIPDFGLYVNSVDRYYQDIQLERNLISFAVSADRFLAKHKGNYEEFIKLYSKMVEDIGDLYPDKYMTFIPHTYYDLSAINDILLRLSDNIRRNQLIVAPLLTSSEGLLELVRYYYKSFWLVGSRFHSCIQGLKSGCHVVALYADHRTRDMMGDVDAQCMSVDMMAEQCTQEVYNIIEESVPNRTYCQISIDDKFKAYGLILKVWVSQKS